MRPSLLAAVSRWVRPGPEARDPLRVVCVADGDRGARLARLAHGAGLGFVKAGSLGEAGALAATDGAIVALDRDLAGAEWKEAVRLLGGSACVVLLARGGGEALWSELAALGGFDVLADAASDDEGIRLLRRARAWCRARA